MDKVEITVIGAGVIGLAIAAELCKKNQNVLLLEKHESFGQETSSRNSEVIHAGIYYSDNSLKASLCVEGNRLLYQLCAQQHIPYKKIGKFIVATNTAEEQELLKLQQQGERNGVPELKILSKKELNAEESAVQGTAALYSPSTGIIDSHSLMKYFHRTAESNGVLMQFNSEVTGITKSTSGYIVEISQENYSFQTNVCINCAGLYSDLVANFILPPEKRYRLYPCKGEYFGYSAKSLVKRLVYPVPGAKKTGLGIHATVDLAGKMKFGPNDYYIDSRDDYSIDARNLENFYHSVKTIMPGVQKEHFYPDMSGIRPKLQGPNDKVKDFVISEDLPGFINLVGIESPGITASLAIAQHVARMLRIR